MNTFKELVKINATVVFGCIVGFFIQNPVEQELIEEKIILQLKIILSKMYEEMSRPAFSNNTIFKIFYTIILVVLVIYALMCNIEAIKKLICLIKEKRSKKE